MPQSISERNRMAYLASLRDKGQLKAYDVNPDVRSVVPIHNPHLVEDDGRWRVEGEYRGHMVSRFVKPPPQAC